MKKIDLVVNGLPADTDEFSDPSYWHLVDQGREDHLILVSQALANGGLGSYGKGFTANTTISRAFAEVALAPRSGQAIRRIELLAFGHWDLVIGAAGYWAGGHGRKVKSSQHPG